MHGKLRKEQSQVVEFIQREAINLGWKCPSHPEPGVFEFITPDGFQTALVVESDGFRVVVPGPFPQFRHKQAGKVLTQLLDRALSFAGHEAARGFVPRLSPLKRPK